jgi:site-specific recombinase XerD
MRSYARFNQELIRRYQLWMNAQQYASATKHIYGGVIQEFCAFLGEKSATSVTHFDIRAFLASLSDRNVAFSSVHRNIVILRVFYDFLNMGGLVGHVAPRFVRLRPIPKKLPLLLSEEEIGRLIRASKTPREAAIIEFIYATGCRVSEAAKVRVKDVNFDAQTARLSGKGGKVRQVLFGAKCKQSMREYIGDRMTGYVFEDDCRRQKGFVRVCGPQWSGVWVDYNGPGPRALATRRYLGMRSNMSYMEARRKLRELTKHACLIRSKSGKPLSTATFRKIIVRAGFRAGLTDISPRMLRHSFATHMLDHGADIRVVQALLGHARLQTTEIYTQTSTARLSSTYHRCHPRGG